MDTLNNEVEVLDETMVEEGNEMVEITNDSKPGAADYAVLGLAVAGAVALGLEGFKLAKKGVAKGKEKFNDLKAKRAAKKAAMDKSNTPVEETHES